MARKTLQKIGICLSCSMYGFTSTTKTERSTNPLTAYAKSKVLAEKIKKIK